MTLRKTAGLLAVAGLVVGLLGSGVGAAFIDQVTGTENINVGTFDCQVTGVTDNGSNGNWFDANSATYNAPTILSSAPGSAPFSFTVKNFGTIPMALSVTGPTWGGNLDGSFSGIAPTIAASAFLAAGASATVTTGIQWTALDNADLGDYGSATWTVACNEQLPVVTAGYATGMTEAVGVRYKAQNTGGEIYLGKADLGIGGNRIETGYTWPDGTYPVSFSFDGTNTITATPGGLAPYVVSSPACASSGWNKLDIYVRQGTGTTAFNNVEINGIPIGSFAATGNWTVSNVNLSQAFTVTGDLVVTGWGTGNEAQKLQITAGCL